MTLRSIILLLLTCPLAVHAADDRGWLGIYYDPVDSLPGLELSEASRLEGATAALRVSIVFPDSPAELGGLREGDLIVVLDGMPFSAPSGELRGFFRAHLASLRAGEAVSFRVIRDEIDVRLPDGALSSDEAARLREDPLAAAAQLPPDGELSLRLAKLRRVLDLEITLGLRPEARWPATRGNDEIFPPGHLPESDFSSLVWDLAEREGVRADTEDLLARLARCQERADPFRLEPVIFAHRDPFRMEALAREYLACALRPEEPIDGLVLAGEALGVEFQRQRLPLPATFEEMLGQIEAALESAAAAVRQAFAGLTDEDRAFLLDERWGLTEVFAEDIYIHFDEDRARYRRNQRLLDLAVLVDRGALFEASAALAALADPDWLRRGENLVRERFAVELNSPLLFETEGDYGRILIGGTAGRWYRETDAAFILDLGGDDLYTGNAGGSAGWALPAALCIDLAGDDAYESTEPSCQGSGCLGVGGLLDLAGDDQYIGLRWAQGTGYYGVGWLRDAAGDDVYRGRAFCQGVGLFGAGLLLDTEGRDRYEGDVHVQACGLAAGVGLLLDRAGDDEYYAKGLYPTGYGDAGIFDAWSQGCATGFRTLASGGLALLIDGGGSDRMEAGNFSQGGGYYYGWGILAGLGPEDDLYIGSRYNQGFSAHQALGTFLEEGGDDRFRTRQGVAQGLAWDECATLFIDEAGDDIYEGGLFFSQGASAHNSFCFFLDRGGRDHYLYGPGPARAGGNNYHGGTSFSLFVDEWGRENIFEADEAPGEYQYRPEHGFFLDLDGACPGTGREIGTGERDPR